MSAYIELQLVGGAAALIEAGSIIGIVTAPGHDIRSRGTAENPTRVLLRGGETIDVVGNIAGHILIRAQSARAIAYAKRQEHGPAEDFHLDLLAPMGDPVDSTAS